MLNLKRGARDQHFHPLAAFVLSMALAPHAVDAAHVACTTALLSTTQQPAQRQQPASPSPLVLALQRGFTLIELLVAVAVLGILATSAVPSMAAAWGRHSVRTTASALAADLRTAQTRAIASGSTTTVCPSQDGRSCSDSADWTDGWVVFTDRDHNQEPDSDASVLRSHGPLRNSVVISNASGGKAPSALSYQALGFASGVQATLVFWDARQQYGICLRSDAGRVSVRSAAQGARGFSCT
jgi:type IV fimbrial biogenesis protein FimT